MFGMCPVCRELLIDPVPGPADDIICRPCYALVEHVRTLGGARMAKCVRRYLERDREAD